MKAIATILVLVLTIVGFAQAINYDFVTQVSNDGPTNFMGTNYLPPDDSGTDWTPLQVGDTFSGVNDFGQPGVIPVGAKLPEPEPVSSMNQDFFNHPPINTLPRSTPPSVTTSTVSNLPVSTSTSAPVAPVAPIAPVNYNFVRQVSNDGLTNFVGTDYLPTSDSDPNWSGWTPLNPGDTFSGVDDFGNPGVITVGPKIVLQKRSTVNSWLTLSRKGGALRVMN